MDRMGGIYGVVLISTGWMRDLEISVSDPGMRGRREWIESEFGGGGDTMR